MANYDFQCSWGDKRVTWDFNNYSAELMTDDSKFVAVRKNDGKVVKNESQVTLNELEKYIDELAELDNDRHSF